MQDFHELIMTVSMYIVDAAAIIFASAILMYVVWIVTEKLFPRIPRLTRYFESLPIGRGESLVDEDEARRQRIEQYKKSMQEKNARKR